MKETLTDPFGIEEILGNPLVIKYGIGLGILLFLFFIYFIIRFIVRKKRWTTNGILSHFILGGVLAFAVFVLSQYLQMALIDFHIKVITAKMVVIVQMILIGLILIQSLFFMVNSLERSQIEKGADKTSAKIITRVLKIAIFLVVLLLFGEHFGLSLSGLMTFGGIGGIAIGFASKDVLSNFFSGVMLFFERPFNIGDWINSPDRKIEGVVKEIGWRSTKIMTFDNRPLYIPNALFSSISVENPGRMTNRRINTEIGLRYEDADKMDAVVNDIRTMLQQNPKIDLTQTLLVYFNDFGESSLNIMIYCFTKTVKWAEWLEAQQEVYLKIIEIVHKNGADFADTTQLLYLDNNEGALKVEVKQPEMPAAPLPEADAVASKVDSTPAATPKS
ncbi:mechanosensitive ion channel protein MscS [Ignatzschineria sp. F8392]|uniref:mechanosensitive ion channel family protein n=1 Tax=Ignatzschineria sp. F8392 TaxID=1980117 RepID=UPI000B9807E0|nr:mechanosensitive ion channel family protein [Ignatzschineria sp. F8392]OYQ79429.1 mechanosensitive ion channel protein MscS [Ignatzschineria sp. F8392]